MNNILTLIEDKDVRRNEAIQQTYLNLNGEGTELNPYKIDNVYALQSLICASEEEHAKITDDIDASGTRKWNKVKHYSESFDTKDRDDNKFELHISNVCNVINVYSFDSDDEEKNFDNIKYKFNKSEQIVTLEEDVGDEIAIDYVTDEDHYMGFRPIGTICGVIDGNGCTIDGLYINRPYKENVGFTNHIIGGEIKQLDITNATVCGHTNVGVISGSVGNYIRTPHHGFVRNCSIEGAVSGDFYIGGLIGRHHNGHIHQSSAYGKLNGNISTGGLVGWNDSFISESYSYNRIQGGASIGGLVGINKGYIKDVYTQGLNYTNLEKIYNILVDNKDIRAIGHVGGLVGSNSGKIENAYTTQKVNDNNLNGCIVGLNERIEDYGGILSNVYWQDYKANKNAVTGDMNYSLTQDQSRNVVHSLSKKHMKHTDFYGFDFENVWTTVDGEYPKFQWE